MVHLCFATIKGDDNYIIRIRDGGDTCSCVKRSSIDCDALLSEHHYFCKWWNCQMVLWEYRFVETWNCVREMGLSNKEMNIRCGDIAPHYCNWNPASSSAKTSSRVRLVPSFTSHVEGTTGQSKTHTFLFPDTQRLMSSAVADATLGRNRDWNWGDSSNKTKNKTRMEGTPPTRTRIELELKNKAWIA